MITAAARLTGHGQQLSIEEVDLPEPSEGQLLVEMLFAGVNPVDRYQVLGRVAQDLPLPRTLGSEGTGLVRSPTDAGETGDPGAFEGAGASLSGVRRVFLTRSALVRPEDGLFARHVLVDASKLVDLPVGVDTRLAAAMGVAGTTAWRCVTEYAQVSPEDRVLVLGASGGVGSIVVSIAHRIGATVAAQTGSSAKEGFVANLGADEVHVGDAASIGEGIRAFRPTVAFDPLGGGFTGAAIVAMAEHGRLVLFGTSSGTSGTVPLQALYRKGIEILGYGGLIEPEDRLRSATEEGLTALAEGRMAIAVDSILPLEEVNDALERLAQRDVRGKLLLDLRA